jgi:hypothetical protein
MYLQKVISKKNFEKKHIFVCILSTTDERSRIRMRIRIRKFNGTIPGSGSVPKMSRIHNTGLGASQQQIYVGNLIKLDYMLGLKTGCSI